MKIRIPADANPSPSTASTSSSHPPRGSSFSPSMMVGDIVGGRLNDETSAPRHPTAVSYECGHLTYFAALLEDMNGDGGEDVDSINIFQRVQDRLVAKHLHNGTLKLTGPSTIRSAGASETSSSGPSSSSSPSKVRRLSFGQRER